MKLLYFGSDYYSTIPLCTLLNHTELSIVGVVTGYQPPRLLFEFETVEELAARHHIPLMKVKTSGELPALSEQIQSLQPDMGLVCSFGYLIPEEIFSLPPQGTLNLHPSRLPQYRGPSPVQQTILNGMEYTGISIMKIDADFDTGDVLDIFETMVFPHETSLTLTSRLFASGTERLIALMPDYINSTRTPTKQTDLETSTTRQFKKEDARIDWNSTPQQILNSIRAFYPKPIAWTNLAELIQYHHTPRPNNLPERWSSIQVNIYQAELVQNKVRPMVLQVEGKKVISWDGFANGYLKN